MTKKTVSHDVLAEPLANGSGPWDLWIAGQFHTDEGWLGSVSQSGSAFYLFSPDGAEKGPFASVDEARSAALPGFS